MAKATYRHRQVLLGYGIDINIRCDRRDDSNVIADDSDS
ncbi:phage/plasmid replication protein [Pseudomonas aeruginosa]